VANTVTHNVVATGTNDAGKQVSKDAWNEGHDIYIDTLTGTAGGAAAAGAAITLTGGTGNSGADAGASITVGGGSGTGTVGHVEVTGEVVGSASMTVRGAAQATEGGGYFTAGTGQSGTRGGNSFLAAGDAGTGLPGGSATLGGGYGDDGNSQAAEITCGGGDGAGTAGAVTVVGAITLNNGNVRGAAGGTGDAGVSLLIAAGSGDGGNDAGGSIELTAGAVGGPGNPGAVTFTGAPVTLAHPSGPSINVSSTSVSVNNAPLRLDDGSFAVTMRSGSTDPSAGGGVAADVASLYARDNGGVGELWVKTGAADTGWTKVI
jgi:hypothetical protein